MSTKISRRDFIRAREEQQKLQDEADRQTLRFCEKHDLEEDEYFRAAMLAVNANPTAPTVWP